MAEKVQEPKLTRIREKGQITLPAEIRRKYNLKEGDLVGFQETPEGILISPKAVIAAKLLDEIGAKLRESGITLEEMLESGRKIRGELLKEMYGMDSAEDA
ncbi:MAG TPA: AbrB/MazE/SpoVT family DNA-binding domain-containing protein [Ktedonobacterales bacterium]